MLAFATRNREPAIGGLIVFIAFLVASAFGEVWQEAFVAGVTTGGLIWLAKTSSHARDVQQIRELVN